MRYWLGLGMLLLFAPVAVGQTEGAPSGGAPAPAQPGLQPPEVKPAPASSPITRQHMAAAFLRFERALKEHPPKPDQLADLNRGFDAATVQFFSGDAAHALEALNDLAGHLIYGAEIPPAARYAASLQVGVDPVVWTLTGSLDITVNASYAAPHAAGPVLRIMANGGEVMSQEPIGSVPFWSGYDTNGMVFKSRQTGPEWMYFLQVLNGGDVLDSVRLFALPSSLDAARSSVVARLKNVPADKPELAQAAAACRSRANLLSDHPSPNESAQFLPDLITLRQDVEREAGMIVSGRDPYRRRPGDYWRTISAAGVDVPCRVYVPSACTDSTRGHPLLIALHGAGADENAFFEGYGAGEIKSLADTHGLIVLCPRTEMLIGNAGAFDGLIQGLGLDYAIDPARVYVLGHSLGGFAAAGLASERADRIAAACCIAGYARPAAKAVSPTLVLTGSLDQIVPTDRVRAAADAAAKAGLAVECRTVENQGHTLIVDAELPAAVEWLVGHHARAAGAAPAGGDGPH